MFSDTRSTQSSFGSPAGSVFGNLVSSASMPAGLGTASTSSVFGSTSGSSSNVFGGPVFGLASSGRPFATQSQDPTKLTVPALNTPPKPPAVREPKRKSLADFAPLASLGDEDRVPPSEAIRFPSPPPPFAASNSAPTLNPDAQSFEPTSFRTSVSSSNVASGSKSPLTPPH
jgi:hypothetical protein